MSAREFLDTNVLVYAHDSRHYSKQARARDLILRLMQDQSGVVSIQVLQEFFSATTRKLGMPSEVAKEHVFSYARFEVISLSARDVLAAIDLHRLHRFSIWDALIVRSALVGGCASLHTEDLQDGRMIENLAVSNPFRDCEPVA